jgi:hypothetical protein
MIMRVHDHDDLPFQFQDDPTLDPHKQELWSIRREFDGEHPRGSWGVISGEELRYLVKQGSEMRAQRK